MGDGVNCETMDNYTRGSSVTHYNWLSVIIPYLRKAGFKVEVLYWNDKSVDWMSKQLIVIGPIFDYSENINEI